VLPDLAGIGLAHLEHWHAQESAPIAAHSVLLA
jgi:hypothetical protein